MNLSFSRLIALFLSLSAGWAQPYIIGTVAGTSRLLDGTAANSVPLRSPRSVALDASGNVYIADSGDNRIRKVSANGIISTIAGTGLPGFTGDRGKAVNARLSGPTDVAVDANGNVYIADHDNFRVRRISLDGTINTVAGNGTKGFSGDGHAATSAQLAPLNLAVDGGGNLYISDFASFRIRKLDTNGIITTIAGNGTPGYAGDNGPALSAEIGLVTGIAIDSKAEPFGGESFSKVLHGGKHQAGFLLVGGKFPVGVEQGALHELGEG